MKLSCLITTISMLLFATGAHAEPKLVVTEPVHNFGALVQGEKFNHIFHIKNSGDSPLTIHKVNASCGCTAAHASSPVIQPGKTGEIKVTFDSANFTGKVTKNVVIDTNDPKTPEFTLALTGTINEEIHITPRQLNLGQIKAGSGTTTTITLTNKSNRPLRILSAKAQITQITAEVKKNHLKPGESGTIEVTITPKPTDRMLSGYLTIATDSPKKGEFVVPIYGSPTAK